jgi:hypothetical protein
MQARRRAITARCTHRQLTGSADYLQIVPIRSDCSSLLCTQSSFEGSSCLVHPTWQVTPRARSLSLIRSADPVRPDGSNLSGKERKRVNATNNDGLT